MLQKNRCVLWGQPLLLPESDISELNQECTFSEVLYSYQFIVHKYYKSANLIHLRIYLCNIGVNDPLLFQEASGIVATTCSIIPNPSSNSWVLIFRAGKIRIPVPFVCVTNKPFNRQLSFTFVAIDSV